MDPGFIVKICGITNGADAAIALDAGADALGFIFHPKSPRHVDINTVRGITQDVPKSILKVGVFVNAPLAQIREAVDKAGLDTVQLHGEEPPGFCSEIPGVQVFKAFRVKDASTLKMLSAYQRETWLLDSYVAGAEGGTGERFNWELAIEAKRLGNGPIVLAGGLTQDNVGEAVRFVNPWGVDVSSGVEASPGRKDPAKVRAFVLNAKAASGQGTP